MKAFRLFFFALLLGVFGGSMYQPAPSKADTLLWRVKSIYPYRVQIEFYSENSRLEWPGGGKAYGLDNNRTHRFLLNCTTGEKICYGAWVTGDSSRYWGVGLHNHKNCPRCCAVCGGDTETPRIFLE